MPALATAANTAWLWGNSRSARLFERSLHKPVETQEHLLVHYLHDNVATDYGKLHQFSGIRDVKDFQERVPQSTYEDYAPFIQRIAQGERGVLCVAPVNRFVPTSGSTRAEKWIPYTPWLLQEFSRGLAPWISNLFHTYPSLRRGPAYWSITPSMPRSVSDSKIPVGFDDDAAYLGAFFRPLVEATFAAPGVLRDVQDIESFRYLTLLCLLRARDLRLISVWHPSFLMLLLDAAEGNWDRLLTDVSRGTVTPPGEISRAIARAMARGVKPDRRRAEELKSLSPRAPGQFWPHLGLISCWADAGAQSAAQSLAGQFPNSVVQGKGLLSTEAFISLPYVLGGKTHYPLAIRSHFFEFLPEEDATATPRLAHALDVGASYTVMVTTGGGLYRYNTHDRIRVTGRCHETPSIEFLGKEDLISDLRGEKLNALFVASVIEELSARHGISAAFAMLSPDGSGYTLFIEPSRHIPTALIHDLEESLCRNPHYAYCRKLRQLTPARVFRVCGNANEIYLEICRQSGQRLGDIKPTALHRGTNWSDAFDGAYIE